MVLLNVAGDHGTKETNKNKQHAKNKPPAIHLWSKDGQTNKHKH